MTYSELQMNYGPETIRDMRTKEWINLGNEDVRFHSYARFNSILDAIYHLDTQLYTNEKGEDRWSVQGFLNYQDSKDICNGTYAMRPQVFGGIDFREGGIVITFETPWIEYQGYNPLLK